jgi:hypothetical protein
MNIKIAIIKKVTKKTKIIDNVLKVNIKPTIIRSLINASNLLIDNKSSCFFKLYPLLL